MSDTTAGFSIEDLKIDHTEGESNVYIRDKEVAVFKRHCHTSESLKYLDELAKESRGEQSTESQRLSKLKSEVEKLIKTTKQLENKFGSASFRGAVGAYENVLQLIEDQTNE